MQARERWRTRVAREGEQNKVQKKSYEVKPIKKIPHGRHFASLQSDMEENNKPILEG